MLTYYRVKADMRKRAKREMQSEGSRERVQGDCLKQRQAETHSSDLIDQSRFPSQKLGSDLTASGKAGS